MYSAYSKKHYFSTFASAAPAEFKSMSFSLGRKNGDTLEPLGFQGTF
jgi:hypothetical protein